MLPIPATPEYKSSPIPTNGVESSTPKILTSLTVKFSFYGFVAKCSYSSQ
jgi:hypothetical protein